MYCAYLRIGNTWRRTEDKSRVLDHDGDCVIISHKDKEKNIVSLIQEKNPTKYVTLERSSHPPAYVVTDHPLFRSLDDEAEAKLRECGKVILEENRRDFAPHSHEGREYFVAGVCSERRDGVIIEKIPMSHLWVATIDYELWGEANKWVDRIRKMKVTRRANARVNRDEAIEIGMELAEAAGFQFGKPHPSQLVAGITLCDEFAGKGKTNEIVKELAAKWLKFKEKNEEKFVKRNWMTKSQAEKVTRRFEAINRRARKS